MTIKTVRGYIYECAYCGERLSSASKYCSNCKTQSGRKKIFDENVEIFKENKKKGYNVPERLKDWH